MKREGVRKILTLLAESLRALSRKIDGDSVRRVKDPMKFLSNLEKILQDN